VLTSAYRRKGTVLPGEGREQDNRVVYQEVCRTLSVIDDFRARLLGLLPLSSGVGIFLLLEANADKQYLKAIGLIGFFASLGLFIYELSQSAVCRHLHDVGEQLEEDMGLTRGQFLHRPGPLTLKIKKLGLMTWVGVAAWIVYLTVLAAWAYLTIVGFTASETLGK
jgi:hypothetical protein